MRDLSLVEGDLISGGVNCMSCATCYQLLWDSRKTAASDALGTSIVLGVISGVVSIPFAPTIAVSAAIGAAVGAISFSFIYNNSSAWNYLQTVNQ